MTNMGTQTHLATTFNPLYKNTLPISVKSPSHTTTTSRRVLHSQVYARKQESDAKKRVVVTGMGVVSVFGNDVDTFYQRLLAGESGIGLIDRFNVSNFSTRFAGQIRDFESSGYINPKDGKRLDDCQRYCIVAGKKALEYANLGVVELSKVVPVANLPFSIHDVGVVDFTSCCQGMIDCNIEDGDMDYV